jgi:catechol 2,3-dioxygenase-like lactoylglutathione lyase family enzyme
MQIARLDHLVLTVADIAKTCEFYTRVLGMEVVTFGEGRTALRFDGPAEEELRTELGLLILAVRQLLAQRLIAQSSPRLAA